MTIIDLGDSIPPNTAHAVSVSLPTWRANVGYEEGEQWVVGSMVTGYPRFFIHKAIQAFAADVLARHGRPGEQSAMLFPTRRGAQRCADFVRDKAGAAAAADVSGVSGVSVLSLVLDPARAFAEPLPSLRPSVSAALFPAALFPVAKQYWQHSGDGVSSRRAEFCHGLFRDGLLVLDDRTPSSSPSPSPSPSSSPGASPLSRQKQQQQRQQQQQQQQQQGLRRGPKRYQRSAASIDETKRTNITTATNTTTTNGMGGHTTQNGSSGGTNGKSGPPPTPPSEAADSLESSRFLEERYGRNLDVSLVENARSAIRRRIAGALTTPTGEDADLDLDLASGSPLPAMGSSARGVPGLREDDVYLTPCGMNAIFTAHQALLRALPPRQAARRSVNFGFPYVDTLKILQKFGPGAIFYGRGSAADLDDLEARLCGGGDGDGDGDGEEGKIMALFCEFPGNPLLACPDLGRIRALADAHGFAVVVDETIGNLVNVDVLPLADVVVSSLTKIFSGDCNVMGGSVILNPQRRYYGALKAAMRDVHEEAGYWAEDVLFMERNSRDFVARIARVNDRADAICAVLRAHPLVTRVYYPKYNHSGEDCDDDDGKGKGDAARPCPNYEARRLPGGGYGGLLSCTLRTPAHAAAFYDALETAKGPSLGTNFTLTSPYVILAHYQELDWAAGFGVPPDLIRISVGLEDDLPDVFRRALKAAEAV